MTDDTDSPPDGLDRDALTPPVRRVLADDTAEIVDWQHAPLAYTLQNPITGGVYRVAGHARSRGAVQPWSLVLKIAHAPVGRAWPDGRVAPPGWGTDPTHNQYWKREALAYRSGLLDDLPGGLVVPRCFGIDERGDDTIRLWLEAVHETEGRPWPLARYGVAARHLGRFNGTYLAGKPLPTEPWLNRGFVRATTVEPARVAQSESLTRAETWAHPLVRRAFPVPVVARLLRVRDEREALLATLEGLPQTLCHLDAFPGNLLARVGATGAEETVALDWAFVGIAAVGEEVGHLVAWSLLSGVVAVADAEALRALVLAGYVEGLREAGWSGDAGNITRAAETGAALAAALRWAFSAANRAVRPAFDTRAATGRETGQPITQRMARHARLVYFLLDWLDDALPAFAYS